MSEWWSGRKSHHSANPPSVTRCSQFWFFSIWYSFQKSASYRARSWFIIIFHLIIIEFWAKTKEKSIPKVFLCLAPKFWVGESGEQFWVAGDIRCRPLSFYTPLVSQSKIPSKIGRSPDFEFDVLTKVYNYGPCPHFGPNDLKRGLVQKVVQMTFFVWKIGPNEKNHQNLLFSRKNQRIFKISKNGFWSKTWNWPKNSF